MSTFFPANIFLLCKLINLPWSLVSCHKKIGPDWFRHFDICWTQTDILTYKPNLYINFAWVSVCLFGCLLWCLSVCLYPINVKTAEPIGPKFFVGHHVTPGKVYGWSNYQKFASIKIRFFLKIREIFCFCFINKKNPHAI